MMKRKRSCSALHLFAVFVAKSGANVSAGSQGGLRTLGICRQCSVSRDVGGEAGADASIRSNISLGANVSTGSQGGLRTLGISTKAPCEAPAMHDRHECKGIYDSVLHAFVRTIRALMVSARPKRPDGAGISV